jgi:hypothetical protein
MSLAVDIAAYGRMSLPACIRKRLGLENGGAVLIEMLREATDLMTVIPILPDANQRGRDTLESPLSRYRT